MYLGLNENILINNFDKRAWTTKYLILILLVIWLKDLSHIDMYVVWVIDF